MEALHGHIYLEEEFIFPALREADAESLGACRDLLTRLDAHNSKEEPIIYPPGR